MLPRRNHLLHDLITRVFLRSLQYGITVMGVIDAFVHAHHQHRQSIENPGNFGDCMKGRIRFLTAVTPAFAHAHQATCLTRHMPAILEKNFRPPKPKARYPHLPNARSTTRERGNDFRGWAIYTDGGTRAENGETFAGWCVIARSHHGRIDVMFGPVITTEPHPAFSGARTHSNNTAEMSAMIEALSFLGPRGPIARDVDSCIYDSKHAAGVCLGTIQARTHVQLALACQRSMLCAQHWPRLAMQHVYGDAANLGDECADHAAALGSLGLISSHNVATLWVRHNFDTSAHCGDCNSISEVLEKLHSIRTEATSLPQDGSKCCVPHRVLCDCHARICITCGFALSLFPRAPSLLFRKGNGKPNFVCFYRVELWSKFRAQHVESSPGIALSIR